MNPEKAIEFIRERGDQFAQARLNYILFSQSPDREIVSVLLTSQRADGGWPPFWAADYSSLDATCFHLAQMEQIGLGVEDVAVARAARFLVRRQQSDGSWEEEHAHAFSAPAWVKPGRRAARLYVTSNCGFWLSMIARSQPGITRTSGYLQEFLDERGEIPSYLQTHWLAAGMWYRLSWREPAERAMERLIQRLDDLPAASIAWMALTLCIAGVPYHHKLLTQAVSYLEHCQRGDGAWSGEDDPGGGDVHTTLEVLRVMRMCSSF